MRSIQEFHYYIFYKKKKDVNKRKQPDFLVDKDNTENEQICETHTNTNVVDSISFITKNYMCILSRLLYI